MFTHKNKKKSKQKAQSIIEYCMVIATVIIAIMVMGPYIRKSWNAHVKTWEYSMNASLNERRGSSSRTCLWCRQACNDLYSGADIGRCITSVCIVACESD